MRCPTLNELPSPLSGKIGWPWTEESSRLPDTMSDGSIWPQITVVTPSYNQGQFIEETIRSVLLQGYPNLNYVIVDGGSTDNSVEVIRKYEPWLAYWMSEPDRGQAHAINKGWTKAEGEILAWLNSDDVYCPGVLEVVADGLTQHPEAVVLCGTCALVDLDRLEIGSKEPIQLTPEHFIRGCNVPGQPAVFLRRQVPEQIGYLNESLHYLLDWEFWLRIGLHYSLGATTQVEKVLAQARVWSGAKTPTAGLSGIAERQMILTRLFRDPSLPAHLHRLQGVAYNDLHWRWAFLQQREGQYLAALMSIFRAIWFNPQSFTNIRRVHRFIVRLLK